MIGYVNLGTNKFEEAGEFYDSLLATVHAQRVMDSDRFVAWGTGPGAPMLSIIKPFNKEPATVGNGVMVALRVETQEQVNAIHETALKLGGADEGAPGFRGAFYAAYFRDLDGNKLNAFCL